MLLVNGFCEPERRVSVCDELLLYCDNRRRLVQRLMPSRSTNRNLLESDTSFVISYDHRCERSLFKWTSYVYPEFDFGRLTKIIRRPSKINILINEIVFFLFFAKVILIRDVQNWKISGGKHSFKRRKNLSRVYSTRKLMIVQFKYSSR